MGTRLGRVARGETYAGHTDLEVEICGTCGVLFAAPEALLRNARADHTIEFFCPNGHNLHYLGKSKAQQLEEQLERERARAGRLVAQRDQLEASLRGTKAAKTRITRERDSLKRRATAGVCPHPECHRHFENLERHVASKHPELLDHLHSAGGES